MASSLPVRAPAVTTTVEDGLAVRAAEAGHHSQHGLTSRAVAQSVPEWLIDNANAYEAMLRAIGSARRSVWMTQLAFDADCVAYDEDVTSGGTLISEAVLGAVARAPVQVRILLNATLLLDTARPLRRFFAAKLAALGDVSGTIEVRGVSCFPQLLHSKMVIVDGTEAFLLGSPFANGYWDDDRHQPVDARRPLRELGGRPVHDVSPHLTGPAVAALERIAEELWDCAAGDSGRHAPGEGRRRRPFDGAPPAGGSAVRIVCTRPRGVLPDHPAGSTGILDALLDGIARARSLIYIEHQYLSARPVIAALREALRRHEDLEIVAVLNQNPDVTAYRAWQNARLAESGLLTHPRAGLFALWSARRADASPVVVLNQIFVHSKVIVVDDEWGTAGSANLDGVSLHSYGDDFTGLIGRWIFRHVRNIDVNVVVDGREGGPPRPLTGLRTRLWSEHLAIPAELLTERPAGGWLPLWRARAAANVAALAGAGDHRAAQMRGSILPYTVQSTPARQLHHLGVRMDPTRLDVRFNPGWLEVQLSPSWVRNMFS